MEDDDLADRAQELLDALDLFLSNARLIAQLSALDLFSIRDHRRRLADTLLYYRGFNSFTERRSSRRPHYMPPQQAMLVAMGTAAVLAPPATFAGGTAATVTTLQAATVAGLVLLPLASALLLSEVTGGSLRNVAGRNLMDAAKPLIRDLLELGTLSLAMAITAEEAAKMTNEELVQKLKEAGGAASGKIVLASIKVLVAELIKRFPQCVAKLQAFEAAAKRVNTAKVTFQPGRYGEELKLFRTVEAMQEAWSGVLTCTGITGK